MKRVFFATNFKEAAAPAANGDLSVFLPSTGAYLDFGQATSVSTYDDIVIQVKRGGKVLSIPYYPKTGTASKSALTAAARNKITFTPTSGLSIGSNTFTFAFGIAGKGVEFPKYTKKITVYGGQVVNGTAISNVETLIDAIDYLIGSAYDKIPGVKLSSGQTASTITLQVDAGYEDVSLIAWGENDLTGVFAGNTTAIAGMSEAEIKKLESDADTELGDRKFNYRSEQFFNLTSGYSSACTDLAVFKSSKPDMYPLPREGNFEQELLLFYDDDKAIGTHATDKVWVREIITWLTGNSATIPAKGAEVTRA